jgi:hypothetical protein
MRPTASLTGTLLFRKGNASPSGFRTRPPYETPNVAAVTDAPVEVPSHRRSRKSGADKAASGVARLSIRLDPEQHRRLRIVAAHTRQSIQAIVMTALDSYIGEAAPDLAKNGCRCLAEPHGDGLKPFDGIAVSCQAAGPRGREEQS